MENQNITSSVSKKRSQFSMLLSFFAPSAIGIWVYLVLFVISVVVSQPSQYKQALEGVNSQSLKGVFFYSIVKDITSAVNSQLASQIAVYVFWVFVAICIYLLASRLTKNVNELADDISLRSYIWPTGNNKNQPVKEFIEKLIFRVFLAVIILIYLFKAFPKLVSLWKFHIVSLSLSGHSIKIYFYLFIVEMLFLHILVILFRLLFLRKRLVNL